MYVILSAMRRSIKHPFQWKCELLWAWQPSEEIVSFRGIFFWGGSLNVASTNLTWCQISSFCEPFVSEDLSSQTLTTCFHCIQHSQGYQHSIFDHSNELHMPAGCVPLADRRLWRARNFRGPYRDEPKIGQKTMETCTNTCDLCGQWRRRKTCFVLIFFYMGIPLSRFVYRV